MDLTSKRLYKITVELTILIAVFVIISGTGHAIEPPSAYADGGFSMMSDSELMAEKANLALLEADFVIPWRGTLIGANHGPELVHHDNAYVQINGGPIHYYTSTPARKEGNSLPDMGFAWHLFSRDQATYTVYASSSLLDGTTSELSIPISILYDFDTNGCTEQTVPIADAGPDQIVQTNTLVTLDGGASYDPYGPDTDDLFYVWECYAAPVTTVELNSAENSPVATFTPTTSGNYYFRFSVRDQFEGASYNRSAISYVRVNVVDDPADPDLLIANAGSPQEVAVGDTVALDGSRSIGPAGFSYSWEQTNPVGKEDVKNLAEVFGSIGCSGACYRANFNADEVVDGSDVAILASNMGPVDLFNADQAMPQFVAAIARPHIFRLTISDGENSTYETTIAAVHHPNVDEVLTPPDVDPICLVP
jgi:hypothetical protein